MAEPVQPSLRRLRAFGITPNRELGQNFLVDSNLLGVIGRAAELGPDDVVLEIGGGLGVLSEYLAEHARHVHVVEVDPRLEPALRDALDAAPQRDAAPRRRARPRSRRARPGADQGRRQPALRDRRHRDPAHDRASCRRATRWVVMVQREVGERLAADPAGSAYGIPSVLAQLAATCASLRHVSRTVFFPVPNVDSVLVELAAPRPAPPDPRRAQLVQGAFAHRRKALARSLALAAPATTPACATALARRSRTWACPPTRAPSA